MSGQVKRKADQSAVSVLVSDVDDAKNTKARAKKKSKSSSVSDNFSLTTVNETKTKKVEQNAMNHKV